MTLSKEEREALAVAVVIDGRTVDGARDLKTAGSEGERYGWATVKRAEVWAKALSLEEARVLKDTRLRSWYEQRNDVPLDEVAETGGDTEVADLRTYLESVRKEIWVMPPDALEAKIEAARREDERAEKFAELERKWRLSFSVGVGAIDTWIVLPRTWGGREGDYPMFIAAHCPEIAAAYDAWAQLEANLHDALNHAKQPSRMTPKKIDSLKAAAAAFNTGGRELLDRIAKVLEPETFPGRCLFCPDHVR